MKRAKPKKACCPVCTCILFQAREVRDAESHCPNCNTDFIINITKYGVNVVQKKQAG